MVQLAVDSWVQASRSISLLSPFNRARAQVQHTIPPLSYFRHVLCTACIVDPYNRRSRNAVYVAPSTYKQLKSHWELRMVWSYNKVFMPAGWFPRFRAWIDKCLSSIDSFLWKCRPVYFFLFRSIFFSLSFLPSWATCQPLYNLD